MTLDRPASGRLSARRNGDHGSITLRGKPVVEDATLPDGRQVRVWVGVPDDPYIRRSDLDTVALELSAGDEVLATVNTVLEPHQESEGRALAREVAEGLASGRLEPTAGAIEPLADRLA